MRALQRGLVIGGLSVIAVIVQTSPAFAYPLRAQTGYRNVPFQWRSEYSTRHQGGYLQFELEVTAGQQYELLTQDIDGATTRNSYLYLWDNDGAFVAQADGSQVAVGVERGAARIRFTANVTGTYYARLRSLERGLYGNCTIALLHAVDAFTVDDMAPSSGPTAGGTSVTITGNGFTAGATATLGGAPLADIVVVDGTTMTATTPALPTGSYDLVVTVGSDQATLAGAFQAVDGPTLTSISPTSGIAGQSFVTIAGTNFHVGMTVTLGGVPFDNLLVASDTQTTALVPLVPPGTYDVTVITSTGSAILPAAFTVVSASSLTVSTINPDQGPTAGGIGVTVSGTGFEPGLQATIGGAPIAGLTLVNDRTFSGTTPTLPAGTYDLTVTTSTGSVTLPNAFTFTDATPPPVALTSISPSEGTDAGGTPVTLTGTGFAAGMSATIGGASLGDIVVVSGTTLTGTSPALPAGTYDVAISVPRSSALSRVSTLRDAFTVNGPAAPTVTAVSPAEGNAAGGTQVTITGTGFGPSVQARIGGAPLGNSTVVDDTTMTGTTPALALGPHDVVVVSVNGQGTLPGGFRALEVLSLDYVRPASGPVTGGATVYVHGTGFASGTQATIGGAALGGLVIDSDTLLHGTTPALAEGTYDLTVVNPGGSQATLAGGFRVTAAPTIASIDPAVASASATTVTIRGTGFVDLQDLPGRSKAVTIGGQSVARVTLVSAQEIQVETRNLTPGYHDVVVGTTAGTATLPGAYHVVPRAVVTSVEPSEGPIAGGTAITIRGTDFVGVTSVIFDANPSRTLADLVVLDDQTITGTVPALPKGDHQIGVRAVGGTGQLGNAFRAIAPPSISSIDPATGSIAGGTAITISGHDFIAGSQVTIDGLPLSSVVVDPERTITGVTPALPAGPHDVVVTHPYGQATLPGGFITGTSPTVTSIDPASGPRTGGTIVTVRGSGFGSGAALEVTIGTVALTGVVVTSDTEVSGTTADLIGAGAHDVTVTTPFGQAILPGAFTATGSSGAVRLTSPSPERNGAFGAAMATGDVDGDGREELFFGVPRATVDGHAEAGEVVVMTADGQGGFAVSARVRAPTPVADAWFGYSVATGDVNADGRTDLVVGMPGSNFRIASDAGFVYVFLADGTGGFGPPVRLTRNASGNGLLRRFGTAVATGDIDGDGDDDVAVGAPSNHLQFFAVYPGEVWTYRSDGRGGFAAGAGLADPLDAGWSSLFGRTLACGDVNGDGNDDVVVGAPQADPGAQSSAGAVVALYSNGAGWYTSGVLLSETVPQRDTFVGAVLIAGDLDGDGRAEVIAGAPSAGDAGLTNSGRIAIFSRDAQGRFTTTSRISPLQQQNGKFGSSLAIADLDGDSRRDLIVGSAGADAAGVSGGAVFALPNDGAGGFGAATILVSPSPESGALFGGAVVAGDFLGDARTDLTVGSHGVTVGGLADAGAAYVFDTARP